MQTTYRDQTDDVIQATTILDICYDAQPFTPAKLNGPPERCHEAEDGYCDVQGITLRRIELRLPHAREPFAVLTVSCDGAVSLAAVPEAAEKIAEAYRVYCTEEMVEWCEQVEGYNEEAKACANSR